MSVFIESLVSTGKANEPINQNLREIVLEVVDYKKKILTAALSTFYFLLI